MHKAELAERLRALIAPVLQAQNLELVDLEFARSGTRLVVRLFVDTPGGVTLNDCARLSGIVGDLLEVHDLITQAYTLEVSSPGLNRPLKTPADYQRYVGRLVRLVGRGPAQKSAVWRGELLGLEDDQVMIRQGDTVHAVPLGEISRARLDFDF